MGRRPRRAGDRRARRAEPIVDAATVRRDSLLAVRLRAVRDAADAVARARDVAGQLLAAELVARPLVTDAVAGVLRRLLSLDGTPAGAGAGAVSRRTGMGSAAHRRLLASQFRGDRLARQPGAGELAVRAAGRDPAGRRVDVRGAPGAVPPSGRAGTPGPPAPRPSWTGRTEPASACRPAPPPTGRSPSRPGMTPSSSPATPPTASLPCSPARPPHRPSWTESCARGAGRGGGAALDGPPVARPASTWGWRRRCRCAGCGSAVRHDRAGRGQRRPAAPRCTQSCSRRSTRWSTGRRGGGCSPSPPGSTGTARTTCC